MNWTQTIENQLIQQQQISFRTSFKPRLLRRVLQVNRYFVPKSSPQFFTYGLCLGQENNKCGTPNVIAVFSVKVAARHDVTRRKYWVPGSLGWRSNLGWVETQERFWSVFLHILCLLFFFCDQIRVMESVRQTFGSFYLFFRNPSYFNAFSNFSTFVLLYL